MLFGVPTYSRSNLGLTLVPQRGVGEPLWFPRSARPGPFTRLDRQISDDVIAIAGLGEANAAATGFVSAARALLPPQTIIQNPSISAQEGAPYVPPGSLIGANSASTSIAGVAVATADNGVAPTSFSLSVAQIAQNQVTSSAAVADPDNVVIGSGTLIISTGRYDSTHNYFATSSSSAVSVSVINGSLNSIATAINASGAGVTASVIQDGSGYHLLLSGNSTGAGNGFRVTAQDADGNNLDTSGLSQLAFDPTLAAGVGQNQTLAQAAQDAVYTIDGRTSSSASNTVTNALPGVSLTLYQPSPVRAYRPASETVTISKSEDALRSGVEGLVGAYNSFLDTLTSLTDPGGTLPQNSVVGDIIDGLKRAASDGSDGGANSALRSLGITLGKDGTLSIDQAALKASFTADAGSTTSAFENAVQRLADYVNPLVASQTYTDQVGNLAPTGGVLVDAQQNAVRDLARLQAAREIERAKPDVTNQQSSSGQYGAILSLGAQLGAESELISRVGGAAGTKSGVPRLSLYV